MAGKEVAEANNPTLGGDREENLVGRCWRLVQV